MPPIELDSDKEGGYSGLDGALLVGVNTLAANRKAVSDEGGAIGSTP